MNFNRSTPPRSRQGSLAARSPKRSSSAATIGLATVAASIALFGTFGSAASAEDLSPATRTEGTPTVSIAPRSVLDRCNGKLATIISNASIIYGTDGDDVIIAAGPGDDSVYAGSGDDTVCAAWHGMTTETLTVVGDEGKDWIQGGMGNDILNGGPGNDTILGSGGDDRINGGTGLDMFDGETGNDTVVYSDASGSVTVSLRQMNVPGPFGSQSKFQSASGADDRDFFNNIENATGSNFADALHGDDDANTLRGDGGGDYIRGNGGNDVVDAEYGDDDIDGGPGVDTVNYTRASQAIVNLQNDVASAVTSGQNEHDTVVGVENATGSPGNDTLTGDSWRNRLEGGDGDDTLLGLSGDDTIFGGAGSDNYDGGPDFDSCLHAGADPGDSYIRCEYRGVTGG